MAIEQSFEIGVSGEVSQQERVSVDLGQDQSQKIGIHRIVEMIDDPDAPIADITKLIAREMALIMRNMTEDDPLRKGIRSQRDLNDQLKAYRELQKTLMESDALSKKDTLNIDGPKFRFVFGEIIKHFRDSLKDAGVDDELAKNVLRQFGDKVKMNEDNLRRDINRIESGR